MQGVRGNREHLRALHELGAAVSCRVPVLIWPVHLPDVTQDTSVQKQDTHDTSVQKQDVTHHKSVQKQEVTHDTTVRMEDTTQDALRFSLKLKDTYCETSMST